MSLDVKYIPLTFISSEEDILNQLRNSVLFSFLGQQYPETTLEHYLESTQYGFTASASDSGRHHLLRITDITNGRVDWNQVPYCDCDTEDKYLLKENDILVARTGGTTGKSFIVRSAPANAVFASYLIRLRLKKGVELSFIESFLNSYAFWPQVMEMKSGTAMPNVNAEKLKTLRLPLCDPKTQKEFVDTIKAIGTPVKYSTLSDRLSLVESLFQSSRQLSSELTHQLSLVKELRQAFLREAMQGKLVPQDPNDEPASELLKKIKAEKEQLIKEKKIKKEKELPPIKPEEIPFQIPKSWVWCRLGDIAYIASGSTPKQDAFAKTGIPYLKMYNLKNQRIEFDYKPQYIKREVHEGQLKRSRAYPGDVIMNIVGPPLGKLAIVPTSLPECNFNQAGVLIRSYEASINPWIYWYLCELSEINSITTKGVAGQDNISVTQTNSMRIPLPPILQQQRILTKLEQLMNFCNDLEQSIKHSQTQNEQLLQQVLREALQPKDEFKIDNEVSLAAEP